MSIIYKNIGDKVLFDVSDDGEQAENTINRAYIQRVIYKLPVKEQKIAEMIEFGYTRREIMEELKVGQHTIERLLERLQKLISVL